MGLLPWGRGKHSYREKWLNNLSFIDNSSVLWDLMEKVNHESREEWKLIRDPPPQGEGAIIKQVQTVIMQVHIL